MTKIEHIEGIEGYSFSDYVNDFDRYCFADEVPEEYTAFRNIYMQNLDEADCFKEESDRIDRLYKIALDTYPDKDNLHSRFRTDRFRILAFNYFTEYDSLTDEEAIKHLQDRIKKIDDKDKKFDDDLNRAKDLITSDKDLMLQIRTYLQKKSEISPINEDHELSEIIYSLSKRYGFKISYLPYQKDESSEDIVSEIKEKYKTYTSGLETYKSWLNSYEEGINTKYAPIFEYIRTGLINDSFESQKTTFRMLSDTFDSDAASKLMSGQLTNLYFEYLDKQHRSRPEVLNDTVKNWINSFLSDTWGNLKKAGSDKSTYSLKIPRTAKMVMDVTKPSNFIEFWGADQGYIVNKKANTKITFIANGNECKLDLTYYEKSIQDVFATAYDDYRKYYLDHPDVNKPDCWVSDTKLYKILMENDGLKKPPADAINTFNQSVEKLREITLEMDITEAVKEIEDKDPDRFKELQDRGLIPHEIGDRYILKDYALNVTVLSTLDKDGNKRNSYRINRYPIILVWGEIYNQKYTPDRRLINPLKLQIHDDRVLLHRYILETIQRYYKICKTNNQTDYAILYDELKKKVPEMKDRNIRDFADQYLSTLKKLELIENFERYRVSGSKSYKGIKIRLNKDFSPDKLSAALDKLNKSVNEEQV